MDHDGDQQRELPGAATAAAEVDPEWENLFRCPASGPPPLERILSGVPMFSLLGTQELAALGRIVHHRHYKVGETVISAGAPLSGFYLIVNGSAEIVRMQPDGSREMVDILGPGALLAEFGLVDASPRSSSVVAAEPSELVGFFRPDLMRILNTRPVMGCKILLRLGEEMAQALRHDYEELRASGYDYAAVAELLDAGDEADAP